MQATCPQCGNRVAIDDAKVPDKPFQVKCPRCQTAIRLQGRPSGPAVAPPAASPASSPSAEPAAPAAAEATGPEDPHAQMTAQVRRELGGSAASAGSRQALVAVPDRAVGGAIGASLARQGYAVDALDDPEEGARLLEQGVYDLVVTVRAASKAESLWQRCARLTPEARRRIFLVLIGDDFRTADGTQAFGALADLVINPKDAASVDTFLRNAIGERTRLYQVLLDARQRFEASVV